MSKDKLIPPHQQGNNRNNKSSNLDRNSDMPTTDLKPTFTTINEGRQAEVKSNNTKDNSYFELIINKDKK